MFRSPLLAAVTAATTTTLTAAPAAEAATAQRVTFDSHGQRLVGDLYLPDGYEAGDRLPAVVVTGAWTTVKEQMPGRYAAELADRGFAALAFDFRNWGESAGDRRQLESPTLKTQDIVAAAAFLAARPEVDPQHLAGLGICASAGYMAGAAAASEHLRSLALVAPWMHDAAIVEQVYGGPESVAALIAASRAADRRFEQTGEETMRAAASTTDEDAVMFNAPYYTEEDRGLIPEYVNQFNVASWEPWLTFDAVRIADDLAEVPTLIVHSDAAAIPQGVRKFYDRLTGEKREAWLEGVSQFEFYDEQAAVRSSADTVADFFRGSSSDAAAPDIPEAPDIDHAAVASTVEAVALLADLGDFAALEPRFAAEVEVDYSSLSGQPAEVMSNTALMTRWAGVLPGFDRTRHTLSDIRSEVHGDTATAAAAVTAGHWVGRQYWEVSGRYDYALAREADGWRVTAITFHLEDEVGSRSIFGPAIEAAKANPNGYLVRQQTRQAVLDFLTGLEDKDMDRVNNVWAEDAVQEMPYVPEGFPQRVAGREALIALYAGWPDNAGEARFTDGIVFYPTLDPQVVFVEYRGDVEVIPTGRQYRQTYGGLFHVEDGKITLFREYYDPRAFAEAFEL